MRFYISLIAGIIFIFSLSLRTFAQGGEPLIYLKFTTDKVYIVDNQKYEFTADIFIGDESGPASNIYATTFDIVFDADLVIADSTLFSYNAQSFLGSAAEISISSKTQASDKGRLNIAISRVDGKNVSGFGKIGTVKFITVSDIIGSREIEEVPFNGALEPLKLLNANGDELRFKRDPDGDTILLINDILARTNRSLAERSIEVFPNPASHQIYIDLHSLQGHYVEIFDAQGRRVKNQSIFNQSQRAEISTAQLNPGIYLVKINTEKGIFTKRIVLQ
ncbi:MAG: T9SS type A sorting domain-containing protein [Saprospiraceae bacterium]|nr:T9SS type A sorting domain-containing protein [Saprospiraceae bacterium]